MTEKLCYLCGIRPATTNDHIPPKNLFPTPRPNNLITVPACRQCNLSASKDDEYFRLNLCMSDKVGDNHNAKSNRETIFRSLHRPKATKFTNSFLSNIHAVQLKSQAGLYLKRTLAFNVNITRIHRVVEKTVRGLFYHETEQGLHPDYGIIVHSDDSLKEYPKELLEELSHTILIPLTQIPPKIVGDDVFQYRFHIAKEDTFCSVWALTFYRQISFLAITSMAPKN
jgi:hypothetical protein